MYNKRFCKEPEKIENYEKAKKDNFKGWHCHHRLETHTTDGIRREVDITVAELKALGMYYNRPASELIFLTSREHNAFNKGKKRSEEAKKKMREANIGKKLSEEAKKKIAAANIGKHHSEETKKKIGAGNKGKKLSEETKKKMMAAKKGEKHPMYGKKHSEEAKKKMREAKKGNTNVRGRHWYNNGKINIMAKECPDGFVPGRLKGEQNPY